ncbi:YciI family protein [uncultured Jatrophihabitans sp.]|uniref:YciI family protein n=1 Tax=uncultured Jatrophihabitans sp. TaxID=1610747 RepID=UPI0035C960E2
MPTFVTIGFGDQAGYNQTDEAVRNRAHAADAQLAESGTVMGQAAEPIQVRNHDGSHVEVSDGPYSSSALPVAGFAIIEAADLDAAIAIAANNPCAVAHGVVEIWPIKDT